MALGKLRILLRKFDRKSFWNFLKNFPDQSNKVFRSRFEHFFGHGIREVTLWENIDWDWIKMWYSTLQPWKIVWQAQAVWVSDFENSGFQEILPKGRAPTLVYVKNFFEVKKTNFDPSLSKYVLKVLLSLCFYFKQSYSCIQITNWIFSLRWRQNVKTSFFLLLLCEKNLRELSLNPFQESRDSLKKKVSEYIFPRKQNDIVIWCRMWCLDVFPLFLNLGCCIFWWWCISAFICIFVDAAIPLTTWY